MKVENRVTGFKSMKNESILADGEFRRYMDVRIAGAIEESVNKFTPIRIYEAMWICKAHGIQCRFDVKGCGQDIDMTRINFTTDGNRNVTGARIG